MEPTTDTGSGDAAAGTSRAPADGAAVGAPRSRRRLVVVAASVVVLLGAVVGGVALLRDGEQPAQAMAPTTTIVRIIPREPHEVVVATARPSTTEVVVRSTPPEGWEDAVVNIAASTLPVPEASQATTPARPPLPRVGFAVEGRTAETGGWRFQNPTVFDSPFTMLVTEGRGEWLQVMVPVRPNGSPGWIRAADVEVSRHRARVEVDVSDRFLRAYVDEQLVAESPVVVGTPLTHTPTGRFYLTDKLDRPPEGFYGPHILALNAYSEQLDTFDDGVPVIAIHGTSRPDQMGQDISNGCIRVPNDVIERLADVLPLGTQVDVLP